MRVRASMVLVFGLLSLSAFATDYGWDGAGGTPGWGNVTNWVPDAAPGDPAADDTVSAPGDGSVLDTNRTIRALRVNASGAPLSRSVSLGAWRLAVTDDLEVGISGADRQGSNLVLSNGVLAVGSDLSAGRIAVARALGASGVDHYGTLDISGCTVTGILSELSIGVQGEQVNGAHGVVRLGEADISASTINVGQDRWSNGRLLCSAGTRLDAGSFYVGRNAGWQNSHVDVSNGTLVVRNVLSLMETGQGYTQAQKPTATLTVGPQGCVMLGSVSNRAASLVLCRSSFSGVDYYGTLDCSAGTFIGYVSTVYVGRSVSGTPGSHGTLKLGRGVLDATSMTVSGVAWDWGCRVELDGTDANIQTLSVQYPTSGGSHPYWEMRGGAVVRVDGSVSFTGSSSTLRSKVTGAPTGFWLADGAGLSLVPAMQIEFHDPDSGFQGHYWGFAWSGSHSNSVQSLVDTGKVTWDDTTYLSSDYAGTASVYYDLPTDTTYVGLIVPVPPALLLLVR